MVDIVQILTSVPSWYEFLAKFRRRKGEKTIRTEQSSSMELPTLYSKEVVLGLIRAVDFMLEEVDYEKLAESLTEKLQEEGLSKTVTPEKARIAVWYLKMYVFEKLLNNELPDEIFQEITLRPASKELEVLIAGAKPRIQVSLSEWTVKILEPQ